MKIIEILSVLIFVNGWSQKEHSLISKNRKGDFERLKGEFECLKGEFERRKGYFESFVVRFSLVRDIAEFRKIVKVTLSALMKIIEILSVLIFVNGWSQKGHSLISKKRKGDFERLKVSLSA